MKKPWSKKSCPREIRGIRIGGYNKPCIHGPVKFCTVCGDFVPSELLPDPFSGTPMPVYGECVNGHGAVDWFIAMAGDGPCPCEDCEEESCESCPHE